MCQGAVRRLCNLSERCHVRKVARLLARPLIMAGRIIAGDAEMRSKAPFRRPLGMARTRDLPSSLVLLYVPQLMTRFVRTAPVQYLWVCQTLIDCRQVLFGLPPLPHNTERVCPTARLLPGDTAGATLSVLG